MNPLPAHQLPASEDRDEAQRIRRELKFYCAINRWLPRSYSLKFLMIAFLGIHLPLIVFVIYVACMRGWRDSWLELVIVLSATLVGTALTLVSQFQLLAPVRASARAFAAFRTGRIQLALPRELQDDAGRLMSQSAECIEELQRLLKLKDRLAAGIAHDFRNPLTGIIIAADMAMLEAAGQPDLLSILDTLRRSALAQSAQVEGLLNAVLDDTRNANFDFRTVEIARLWSATLDTLKLAAMQRRVTLRFESSEAKVGGDEARLTQVLNNLVSNAIKASPAGSTITVSAETNDKCCTVHVRDGGPGVDVQSLRLALAGDDVVQNPGDPKTAARSLGLGLRMVQSLLRLHATRLNFNRRPEGGSDFWFELMIAR